MFMAKTNEHQTPAQDPPLGPPFFWDREVFNFSVVESADVSRIITQSNSLSRVQTEVGKWAYRNFSDKALGPNPLIGVIEEVGELARAILKMDYGIRGSNDQHHASAIDAIGDTSIYLMNLLSICSVDFGKVYYESVLFSLSYSETNKSRSVVSLSAKLGMICKEYSENGPRISKFAVIDFICELISLSKIFGTNLAETIENTWMIVSQRDWVKDPKNGGGHSHITLDEH